MRGAFDEFAEAVRRASGIVVDAARRVAVESRLEPLARRRGHEDVPALIAALRRRDNDELLDEIVDAMTTNETFFFRDRAPFRLFSEEILPYLVAERASRREIRIWSAACSTGQEPYSLAILLDQAASKLAGWRVSVNATDISRAAIEAAREGLFNQFEAQRGMPANVLLRYFEREGTDWRISEELRSKIRFARRNLLEPFDGISQCDVIFCRNVLIYFDRETRRDVLSRLAKILRPDGFLVLGATESIAVGDPDWTAWRGNPHAFVRTDGPHALATPAPGMAPA